MNVTASRIDRARWTRNAIGLNVRIKIKIRIWESFGRIPWILQNALAIFQCLADDLSLLKRLYPICAVEPIIKPPMLLLSVSCFWCGLEAAVHLVVAV
jgi:hypothetical protein